MVPSCCRECIAALQSSKVEAAAAREELDQMVVGLRNQLDNRDKHVEALMVEHEKALQTRDTQLQVVSEQCIANVKQMKVS